jgi:hypothetical protein
VSDIPLKCQARTRLTCFYLMKCLVNKQHFLCLPVSSPEPASLEVSRDEGSILLPDQLSDEERENC